MSDVQEQSSREHAMTKQPAEAAKPREASVEVLETKDGLPVISEDAYKRMYNTDVREMGEVAAVTFDFQGFVKIRDENGKERIVYKDVLATNGLLRDGLQPGIHIGTDGIVDYTTPNKNRNMQESRNVARYDIYVTVPGALQREKGVVCKNDSCKPLGQFLKSYSQEEAENEWNGAVGYIVIQLHLDPKEDPEARKKAQLIHGSMVRHLERGGSIDQLESVARRIQDELERNVSK